MKYDDKSIYISLVEIFKRRTGIDFRVQHDLKGQNLLGEPIYLPPRELVMIYKDVVCTFQMQIPKEIILRREFNSFDNIFSIIEKLI